jgi:hypothetical protein
MAAMAETQAPAEESDEEKRDEDSEKVVALDAFRKK